MIDALIAGKISGKPEIRTCSNGKTFITAKLRATASDGSGIFVNLIGFSEAVVAALSALAASLPEH